MPSSYIAFLIAIVLRCSSVWGWGESEAAGHGGAEEPGRAGAGQPGAGAAAVYSKEPEHGLRTTVSFTQSCSVSTQNKFFMYCNWCSQKCTWMLCCPDNTFREQSHSTLSLSIAADWPGCHPLLKVFWDFSLYAIQWASATTPLNQLFSLKRNACTHFFKSMQILSTS